MKRPIDGEKRSGSLAFLASFAVLSLILHACAFVDRAERIALVYGVSRYVTGPENDGSGPNLRFCDDDAEAMALLFERNGYTVLRRISGDTNPTAELPSKAQLLIDLASLPPTLDRVVFYFSGHGEWDETADRHFILPYGSITGTSASWAFDLSGYLGTEELHSALESAGVPQTVLILDACFAGGFIQADGSVQLLPPAYGPEDVYGGVPQPWPFSGELAPPLLMEFMRSGASPGALVLSAAGAEEFSWEDASEGHGVFTLGILRAPAQGADANADSVVTVLEAYAYAAKHVNSAWNELLGSSYYDFMPRMSSGALDYALFSAE